MKRQLHHSQDRASPEQPNLYDRISRRRRSASKSPAHRKYSSGAATSCARGSIAGRLDAGEAFQFLSETRSIRHGEWTIAPIPDDLRDRRVEITGPVERKMVINALNSGASTFMADFEDSATPSWENMVRGQINLRQAVDRTISFKNGDGRSYELNEKTATLMVRPRGWHLLERHMLVDGDPVSASLFDFGIFFFHNAERLVAQSRGPYFYMPKIESHNEPRLRDNLLNKPETACTCRAARSRRRC